MSFSETKDKLNDIIQPLNELLEREVYQAELEKIVDVLKKIIADLTKTEHALVPSKKEISELLREIEALLHDEKENKVKACDAEIVPIDRKVAEMTDAQLEAERKLKIYEDLLKDAKLHDAAQNPQLLGKLKQLEKEADLIDTELQECAEGEKDSKRKRDELKSKIDRAYLSPDEYTFQEVDDVLASLQELKGKVGGIVDQDRLHCEDLDARIKELKDMLRRMAERKNLEALLKQLEEAIKESLANLKDVLKRIPAMIEALLKILQEMERGSLPDKSADYWEERKDILKWIAAVTKA